MCGQVVYKKAFEQVKNLKKEEVYLVLVPLVDCLGASGFIRGIIKQDMFQIDVNSNRIFPLQVKSFDELGFKEKKSPRVVSSSA